MKVFAYVDPQPARCSLVLAPHDGDYYKVELSNMPRKIAQFVQQACVSHDALFDAVQKLVVALEYHGIGSDEPVSGADLVDAVNRHYPELTAALALARGEA